jgi:hypothetical protein
MCCRRFAVILLLVASMHCGNATEAPARPEARTPIAGHQRGMAPSLDAVVQPPETPIDWAHSAAIFIGIQQFHRNSGLEVPYAADDAVDLAYLLIRELRLLPASRAVILLAGHPGKPASRMHLEELRSSVTIVEDEEGPGGFLNRECVNAASISSHVRDQARRVGVGGILIVSMATHGFTTNGQHRLLTADASDTDRRGVVLAQIIETIQAARAERLLLLIDACREQREADAWPAATNWQPRPPQSFLEDLNMQIPYAVMASTGPGGIALSNQGNGLFTRAVLEGLRCGASSIPDGFVTLNSLSTYVSDRVRELSQGIQQTESRFGGLGGLSVVHCDNFQGGEIVTPKSGDVVEGRGVVEMRVTRPELFATVIVCAAANNVCYNQSPDLAPIPTNTNPSLNTRVAVQYGSPDTFRVYVALTADRDFLRGEAEWPSVPLDRIANGVIYWRGPVEVTLRPH